MANISKIHKLASCMPQLYNAVSVNKFTSNLLKKTIGFAKERELPKLYKTSLKAWYNKNYKPNKNPKKTIYLFVDEFTNYMDVEVGIAFINLLSKLGYNILISKHVDSGRAEMSKGLLKQAKSKAENNIKLLKDIVNDDSPLVGIEPSALLSFRDEYLDLVCEEHKNDALNLSKNVLLYDEFIVKEIEKGNIIEEYFGDNKAEIKLHGHCHQKSLASVEPSKIMLSLPTNYSVDVIPSGCCGMAGSFGYEKEHYDLSIQIGETSLFPELRKIHDEVIISAPGTSCRQQIKEGVGKIAYHPIELLYNILK